MKVKSEREVAQSCLTLSDPMDCSPPGSSVHGILQAKVLEWTWAVINNFRLEGFPGFPGSSTVKNAPAMQETQVRFLGWEDALEKG